MVAYNFQKQFVDLIERGIKTQTIRQTARAKPGDALQLYVDQRTKNCKKITDAVCTATYPVKIHKDRVEFMTGQCHSLRDPDDLARFAKADGFVGYMEMADFFREKYGSLPFEGFVIYWRIKE